MYKNGSGLLGIKKSTLVYICSNCGHIHTNNGESSQDIKCSKCQFKMIESFLSSDASSTIMTKNGKI